MSISSKPEEIENNHFDEFRLNKVQHDDLMALRQGF